MEIEQIENRVQELIRKNYKVKNPEFSDCDELSYDLGIEDKAEFAELINNEFSIELSEESIENWDYLHEVYEDIELLVNPE